MAPLRRPRVAIVSAVRTPIGKFGGRLRGTAATRLGAIAARAAIEGGGVTPRDIPELLFGHCIQAGAGQNSARQVARGAGIPDSAGASTVNMVCGSSLKALQLGFGEIAVGAFPRVLVGGMESMDSAPFLVSAAARWGLKHGATTLDDSMLRDALLDAYGDHEHMGRTGERIARKYGFRREQVDAFAVRSHRLAATAVRTGLFDEETVPVAPEESATGQGLERDEGPRGESTLATLGKLSPSFEKGGVLTAGNSSQLSDGAAALLLASEADVEGRGLRPLAWVHSGAVGGVHPRNVMEAPIPTVRRHLREVGLTPAEFDRVEHNEAFASASLAVQQEFGFTDRQFNVHGGAIALGHPIGATGARLVVTLVHELKRARARLGLATLCMGGGNGLSLIVDREGPA